MSDQVLEMLERIEARLDKIENRIDSMENFAKTDALNTLSILTDSIDEYCAPNDQSRRNMSERVEHVVKVIDLLTQTDAIKTLESLVEKAPELTIAIEQLEALPNVLSILTDSVDEFFQYAQCNGLDVKSFSENLSNFSIKLLMLLESGNFKQLLESGILNNESIDTLSAMGNSLTLSKMNISQHKTKSVGPLGVLSAMFDPEVQKSLGFLLDFTKHFGTNLTQIDQMKRIQGE